MSEAARDQGWIHPDPHVEQLREELEDDSIADPEFVADCLAETRRLLAEKRSEKLREPRDET